jgi:hypothetical protein
VHVVKRGHDGLAGEIDAGGASRRFDRAPNPYRGNPAVFDDERAVLDGRARVADDQPRTFIQNCVACISEGRERATEDYGLHHRDASIVSEGCEPRRSGAPAESDTTHIHQRPETVRELRLLRGREHGCVNLTGRQCVLGFNLLLKT